MALSRLTGVGVAILATDGFERFSRVHASNGSATWKRIPRLKHHENHNMKRSTT